MTASAAAPSEICEAVPAVTTPSARNGVLSVASFSSVVSRRMPSSCFTPATGSISASNSPASCARAAAAWLASAYSSSWAAGEAPPRGHHLGADALVELGRPRSAPGPRPVRVGAGRAGAHRHPGHRLDAAGHHQVGLPGDHRGGGEVQRLLARPALPVERGAGHRLGPAGGEHRVAADVPRLLADLRDAAPDHVVDVSRVEAATARPGPAARARTRSTGCTPARPPLRRPTGVRTAPTITASRMPRR